MEASSRSSDCPNEEELWLHFAGSLSGAREETIVAHLSQCNACASLATPEAFGASTTIVDERYVLGGLLGRGVTAVVRAARDEKLGIDVAVKLFMGANAKQNTKRVLQELVVARKINHPNVCRMYDFGEVPGGLYLSMELVSGGTLADRFAKQKSPDSEAHKFLMQIVDGLEAAHRAGIVHRDLKPQNILISQGDRIVITDFGLARFLDSEESRAQLVGTPAYWSPEQARGEPATCASDVYSLGVIAYRLFTGKAFSLSNPGAFRPLPRRYRSVIRRCLSPLPMDRYRDASGVKHALLRSHGYGYARTLAMGAAIAVAVIGGASVFGSVDTGSSASARVTQAALTNSPVLQIAKSKEPGDRRALAETPSNIPVPSRSPAFHLKPVTPLGATVSTRSSASKPSPSSAPSQPLSVSPSPSPSSTSAGNLLFGQ